MEDFGKLKSRNHMTFRLLYHVILSMKYRKDMLLDGMLTTLESSLRSLAFKWGCELIEFGGEDNHVHFLLDAHPNLNLSDLLKNMKSVSSRKMRKVYAEEIRKELWGGEFWSDGTTVITVGGRATLDKLIPYIQNQQRPTN